MTDVFYLLKPNYYFQVMESSPALKRKLDAKDTAVIKRYQCDFEGCGKFFSQSGSVNIHKRIHTGIKPFICDIGECKKAFSQKGDLMKHNRTHTNLRPFTCKFEGCKKAFAQISSVHVHERTHTLAKPFVCDFENCQKAYSQSGHLITHKRVHTGVKPFLCDFDGCGRQFSQIAHLKTHIGTHIGTKPFVCNINGCQKAFLRSGDLGKHKRRHTDIRPFQCNFDGCGKSFRFKGDLTAHNLTHTDIKPFVCKFKDCHQAFSRLEYLNSHKRVHSGIKAFSCTHCNFATMYRSYLKTHIQRHEEQASFPHACKMQDGGTQLCQTGDVCCNVRTLTEFDMLYHIERNHTIEGIAMKFQSETKLAHFFDLKGVLYDRDWTNRICFNGCKAIEGRQVSARPDFYLLNESVELGVVFLVGNDEFEHRYYACDSQRVHNIVQALEQTSEFRNIPIVYIRFNPHHYWRNSVLCSHSLENGHSILWRTIKSIRKDDIHPGLNLVYVHYDMTNDKLDIFESAEDNDYALLHKECIIKLV